jgi:predicted  nucleic acid-binding Zn-ribbon protein
MADKKETTVENKLRQLYALQEIDSELDQIEVLKGELPIEVSDLEDEIVGLETRAKKLQGAIDDVKDEISKHNANIEEAKTLEDRYKKQLDQVKNNREYDALSKEIELQGLEVQLSEKKIRDAQVKIDAKKETLDEVNGRIEEKKKDLEIKKVELEKIIADTEKQEKKLQRTSKAAQKEIEPRLIKAYTKVRERYRNGLAVVTVERDACSGCFNQIPPQMQLEIGMRRKVIVCEHCGRILVDPAIAGKEEEAEAK